MVTVLDFCGDVVGGVGLFVMVGDDGARELSGVAAAAAAQDVQSVRLGLLVLCLPRFALVELSGVGLAAAGQSDVQQCAGGVFAEHGVCGVGGDALGGVHADGIAVGDVLAQIVAGKGGAGAVVEAAGGGAGGLGVGGEHPPTGAGVHPL